MTGAVVIRPATPADAPALAHLNRAARAAAMPWLREVRTEAAVRDWIAGHLIPRHRVRVAEAGAPRGYVAFGEVAGQGTTVFDLYLDPGWWRRGLGRRLLAEAGEGRLTLHCFAANHAARRFYEAAGFRVVAEGENNEEGVPDVTYAREAR